MDSFPKNVTAVTLAKLLSVDRRTITRLTAKGILRKSARGGYDTVESIAAHAAHLVTLATAEEGKGAYGKARAQYMLEKVRMIRLQRERLEGSALAVDEVEARWVATNTAAKNAFVSVPTKLAAQLAAESSPAKCQQILRDEIHTHLADLAQGKFVQRASI